MGKKGSSAHWVKADKPLHRDFPASGVFHVVEPVRFQMGSAQSPLTPIWFDSGRIARQSTGNLERTAAKVIDRMLRIYGHGTRWRAGEGCNLLILNISEIDTGKGSTALRSAFSFFRGSSP
jgi:hypothetical protein